jgi:hypothetical protein
MVSEKIDAGFVLRRKALRGDLGLTPAAVTANPLAHYRRKVRANRRRLFEQPLTGWPWSRPGWRHGRRAFLEGGRMEGR